MSSQGSRLTQLQLRYQQKVMQENAQKKSDVYGYDETQKMLTSSLGAGKVRAMFDERRSRAGIDKSYLLEPITVETTKTTTTKRQVIGPATKAARDQKMSNYSKVIVPPLQNRINHDINGNNHYSSVVNDTNTTMVNFNKKNSIATKPRVVNNNNASTTKRPTPSVPSPPTPSPPLKNVTNQKASPSRSLNSGNSTASSNSNSVRSMVNGSAQKMTNSVTRNTQKVQSAVSAKSVNSQQNSFDEVDGDDQPAPEGLVKCAICKRNFAEDRLAKHQAICQKTKAKKRKVYDASKKRVQGTEAETYVMKPLSSKSKPKLSQAAISASPNKNNNWRAKHEDFIKTIRAAKQMQAYVAKGGKLSDLPPPPPSENPDYVQCPHCSRRFNEAAATRHIPICQSINKPKPKATGLATKTSSFSKRR